MSKSPNTGEPRPWMEAGDPGFRAWHEVNLRNAPAISSGNVERDFCSLHGRPSTKRGSAIDRLGTKVVSNTTGM